MGIKFTYEKVKDEFNKKGYLLLSPLYEGCFKKLNVVCPNGHSTFMSFNNFYNHSTICSTCSKKRKHTVEEVSLSFEKEGYTLISKTYRNCDEKLQIKCPLGHLYFIDYYHFFNRKQRCVECSGHKKHELQYVKEAVEKDGYSLLSTEYENSLSYIDLMCSKGHLYSPSFHSFKDNGSRCPICGLNGISKAEIELSDAIKKVHSDVRKKRDRKVKIECKPYIKGFEIDIFIPALNKGIEFDGTYYHSFDRMRADPDKIKWSDDDIRNYHPIKDSWFSSIGIQILHIKEVDWNMDKEACIKRCLDFLAN